MTPAETDSDRAAPTSPVAPPVGAAAQWRHLVAGATPEIEDEPIRVRRVLSQVAALTVLVVVLVALASAFAARRVAEREAVNDTAVNATLIANAVIRPAITPGLITMDPTAIATMDDAVRTHLLASGVVRVKLWRSDGTIVYSDEPRLIGLRFELDDEERTVLGPHPATRAEVTDLDEPENEFERGQGRLLEVYRPVGTDEGQTLLFEMYAPYNLVTERSDGIWVGFASLTVSTMLVLLVLLMPVLWSLLDRLRAGRAQRERLLQRALEASHDERRRIAAGLHDGVVQELAATSYLVSGAAARASAAGQRELSESMDEAAAAVRSGINGLRSLLVDIYPPSLESTGLRQALVDLVDGFATHDVEVTLALDTDGEPDLDRASRRLFFQIAQETVRNAVRHSGASAVRITLEDAEEGGARLVVEDDGVGFEVDEVLDSPEHGHFGLRLLLDAARENGADLWVATAPGAGTTWCLEARR